MSYRDFNEYESEIFSFGADNSSSVIDDSERPSPGCGRLNRVQRSERARRTRNQIARKEETFHFEYDHGTYTSRGVHESRKQYNIRGEHVEDPYSAESPSTVRSSQSSNDGASWRGHRHGNSRNSQRSYSTTSPSTSRHREYKDSRSRPLHQSPKKRQSPFMRSRESTQCKRDSSGSRRSRRCRSPSSDYDDRSSFSRSGHSSPCYTYKTRSSLLGNRSSSGQLGNRSSVSSQRRSMSSSVSNSSVRSVSTTPTPISSKPRNGRISSLSPCTRLSKLRISPGMCNFKDWFREISPNVKIDCAVRVRDGTLKKDNFTCPAHMDAYYGAGSRESSLEAEVHRRDQIWKRDNHKSASQTRRKRRAFKLSE